MRNINLMNLIMNLAQTPSGNDPSTAANAFGSDKRSFIPEGQGENSPPFRRWERMAKGIKSRRDGRRNAAFAAELGRIRSSLRDSDEFHTCLPNAKALGYARMSLRDNGAREVRGFQARGGVSGNSPCARNRVVGGTGRGGSPGSQQFLPEPAWLHGRRSETLLYLRFLLLNSPEHPPHKARAEGNHGGTETAVQSSKFRVQGSRFSLFQPPVTFVQASGLLLDPPPSVPQTSEMH